MTDEPDPLDGIRSRFAPGYPPSITVDKGWRPLLIDLDVALTEADPSVRYIVITQKYGALRIYTTPNPSQRASRLIREAEKKSATTCEMCGGAGASLCTRQRWFRTLCPSCATEQKYETVEK